MLSMRLGVRGKLFMLSLALILGVILATGIYLEISLGQWLENHITNDLRHHASSGKVLLQAVPGHPSIALMDRLADRLGRATGSRITIIGRDGKVLGDSQLEVVGVMLMDNHGTRPEIQTALYDGFGSSKRYSTTLETNMMFVAIRFMRANGHTGVIRAAMSLEDVAKAKVRLRWLLVFTGMFAIAAAISMSGLNAHFATRTLRALVRHVHDINHKRVEIHRQQDGIAQFARDEIGGLAGSFNRLASELEESVETLSRERNRMAAVLEGMSEGVLALDRNQIIKLVNHSAISMLGLKDSPINKTLQEAIPVEALARMAYPGEGSGVRASEIEITSSHRRIQVQRRPTRMRGGCALVLRDVTEFHQQEQVRRDFVANVSHELRTPVSIILANADTLLSGPLEDDPEMSRKLAQAVERNALRMSRIITDLLDLAMIESGHYNLHCKELSLHEVALQALESALPQAQKKEIAIHHDMDPALQVFADASALEQILFNLLDNAIKYTQDQGRIDLRARMDKDRLLVEVQDNGIGIDAKHFPHLFERFYRICKIRSNTMGSTGLGLTIVKRLLEQMDGLVGVESIRPRGSLFWFSLPCPVGSNGHAHSDRKSS